MSRTKKLLAVGAVAFGLVAAASGPALASRHTTTPPSGHQVSMGPQDSRHTTVAPMDSRHET